MGDRGKDMGDMRAIRAKMAAKYDNEVESTVRGWLKELTGDDIGEGQFDVERSLKNGQTLLKLMSEILSRTANKPTACTGLDIKAHTMNVEFKHMENINKFLGAAEAYGVPRGSLFQTPDLYEGRNMAQVLSTLVMLGSETRRNNMNGPSIGPNPTTKNFRTFTDNQLHEGKNFLSYQAGTNKCASQKGMVMGGVRHISDIKVTELDREAYPEEVRRPPAAETVFSDQQAPAYSEPEYNNQDYSNDVADNEQGGWNEDETQAAVSFPAESEPAEDDGQATWGNEDDNQATMSFGGDADDNAVIGGSAWTDDAVDESPAEATFGDVEEASAGFVVEDSPAEATFGDAEETSAGFVVDDSPVEATFGDDEESSATINLSL